MEKLRIHVYCSSSVSNFKDKLLKKFDAPSWSYTKLFKPTLFFGMYHWHDYKRLILHRGKRYVMWCGSDILNLSEKNIWIFKVFKAKHYCENHIEAYKLFKFGIIAIVNPLYLGEIPDVSYVHSKRPHVWICMHEDREKEYGLYDIIEIAPKIPEVTFHIYGMSGSCIFKNVIFHGKLTEEQFNKDISKYQAGLRFNEFDGFSEVISKSVLMGQYPISRIEYKNIDHFETQEELIKLLGKLKYKKYPNMKGCGYWKKKLKTWTI